MARAFEILSREELTPETGTALTLVTLLPQHLAPTPAHSAAGTASTGPPLQTLYDHTTSPPGLGVWDVEGAMLGCRAAGRWEDAFLPRHGPISRSSCAWWKCG